MVNKNSPFQLLQYALNFQNLFLIFLFILKCFLAALLSDMKCLPQHYSDFDFSVAFSVSLVKSHQQVWSKCWLLF